MQRPRLFRFTGEHEPCAVPAFETPLGTLTFELLVAGAPLAPVVFVSGEVAVAVWEREGCELLLVPVSDVSVTGARAAVWRIAPNRAERLLLRCVWAQQTTWTECGAETGENLDAQTWTDGHTKVSVGLPEYDTATTFRRDGFEVEVTALHDDTGHILCAWAPDAPGDVSTWLAVDRPTASLLPTDERRRERAAGRSDANL